MMGRILILANDAGGLYKFRKELIQELVKKYEVYISLPNGTFIPKLIELGCTYIETPISRRGTNPVTDLILLLKYINIVKYVKPDVVLTYTIKPNAYGGIACQVAKRPYIANITGLGTAVENKGLLQKITLLLYKKALKKAECVFFQNNENRQFFIDNRIVTGKNRLIPGSGVNLEEFHLLDYPSDDIIHFLFVARVMKEKVIDQYLDAAKVIKKKYPNTMFHVIGYCEENYKDQLKNAEENGIIKYHGLQSDVCKFYKISHCTIHPTYYPEGMSNVLLESCACGRPIITTNRTGCREIVEDGVNGYIVEQKNSQDLIEKIENFIKLDYEAKKKMGLAGRKKVECEFDRKIVVEAYMNEVEKTIGGN